MSGIYKLASGMTLEMKRQESIAHNLAGSSIPGYRAEYVSSSGFSSALGQAMNDLTATAGEGVDAGERTTSFAQGPIETTSRSLDFALNGDGMFEVILNDGTPLYTRNGAFQLSSDGMLVTRDGYLVSGTRGPISFPNDWSPRNLEASEDGSILLRTATGTETIGKLKVVTVPDDQKTAFIRATANYFALAPEDQQLAAPATLENCRVVHRGLEGANTSAIREMSTMIQSLRDFETAQRVMQMRSELTKAEQQKLMS